METQVPADVRERFIPAEQPSFKVIRQHGDVRLWESRTRPVTAHGYERPARTHWHITTGDSADAVFISRYDNAVLNFDRISGK